MCVCGAQGQNPIKEPDKRLAGKKLGSRVGEKAEHAKLVSFVIKKIINVLCATTGKKLMLKKNTHTHVCILYIIIMYI